VAVQHRQITQQTQPWGYQDNCKRAICLWYSSRRQDPQHKCLAHTICHYCKKEDHFQHVCKARLTSEKSGKIVSYTLFLGNVDFHPCANESYVSIKLDDRMCYFRVDTGADVTAIPQTFYIHLHLKI